ncbi:caspase, EACC1-associated type [Actinoplanes sp. HUAS TT8]|uniref:caspase, EACC1-associated type n=1 Tax=Actinoplanes sp. HUAS TT8 TaxID=3447453 RepID=UPI003F527AFC
MYRALLVCNSTYDDDSRLVPLHGPRTDGRMLSTALVDERTGMFAPADVTVLFDAGRNEIALNVNQFFSEAAKGDVLLLYFSGHGRSRNGRLYLCATDTSGDLLPGTALSNETLNEIMNDSLAQAIVIILDCCHAGAFKGSGVAVEQLLSGKGRFVLAATGATQLADDAETDGQPSPFTRAVIEGLLHGAVDGDGDGHVDVAELYKFLSSELTGGPAPRHRFDGHGAVPVARRVAPAAGPVPPASVVPAVEQSDENRPYLDLTTTATFVNPRQVAKFRRKMRRDVGRATSRRDSAATFLHAANLMRDGRLTRAGALLFGENPTAVIPTATVQCTHYHGTGKDAPIDKRNLSGTVPEQIEEALAFVAALSRRGEAPTAAAAVTEAVHRFPMVAVREVIANALVHRDYADTQMCVHVRVYTDRVEITSPGRWHATELPDGRTQPLRDLQGESRHRNFWLAHVLSWNSLVETEGAGIPRAVADCRAHGAIEPTVTRAGDSVTVTIYPRPDEAVLVSPLSGNARIDNLPLGTAVFEGRDLDVLAAVLHGPAGQAAVHGLGGIGKSEFALHYARAYRDRYRLVWWINADTEQNVTLGLAALAARLRPTGILANAREWAVSWLQGNRDWLLILDNVEEVAAVEPLLGEVAGRGGALITTRRNLGAAGWARLGVTAVSLGMLDPASCVRVLTRMTGLDDESGAARLAADLGGLPLALSQAAAFISLHQGMDFDGYRELLASRSDQILGLGLRDRSVAGTLRVTMDAVAQRSATAARLISALAWLAADPLPEDVLLPLADDPIDLQLALGLLQSFGLIDRHDGALTAHRLVLAVARSGAEPGDEIAARLLRTAVPEDPVGNVAGWARWNQLLPHVDALIEQRRPDMRPADLLNLAEQAATYRLFQGETGTAVTHFEWILGEWKAFLGEDHPDTLTARHNLASAYQIAGRLDDAIELHEQALDAFRRLFGEDTPETLASMNNLARAYAAADRLKDATRLQKTVIETSRSHFGDDHPDTLKSRHNLAISYATAGRMADAIELFEQVLADRERVLSGDHPATLTTRHNLAAAYAEAGRTADAITLFARVLADRERVLGSGHPTTRRTREALGELRSEAGDPV